MVNLHPVDKTKIALMKLGFDNIAIKAMMEGKTIVTIVDGEHNEVETSYSISGIGKIGYSLQISVRENIPEAIPYTGINTFRFEEN